MRTGLGAGGNQRREIDGFDIELSIESGASAEEIAQLTWLAHRKRFTEDTLSGEFKLTTRHLLNGRPIQIEVGGPRAETAIARACFPRQSSDIHK